ncbi:hypothetical protein P8452_47529 [Trifolium repens]|nr:hypothetical protein P8452_47529 [Trifolium repens]
MEKGKSHIPLSLKTRHVMFSIFPKISGKFLRVVQFLRDMVLREGIKMQFLQIQSSRHVRKGSGAQKCLWRRLVTGKAPLGTPNYSAAVGDEKSTAGHAEIFCGDWWLLVGVAMRVVAVGDGKNVAGLAGLFHGSCWWFLVVGKACRLATLFDGGNDIGRLLESGCCRWQMVPPAAIVKHKVSFGPPNMEKVREPFTAINDQVELVLNTTFRKKITTRNYHSTKSHLWKVVSEPEEQGWFPSISVDPTWDS